MSARRTFVRRLWLPTIALAAVAACHAPATLVTARPPAPPSPDVSYDWHVLVIAPFGSTLKDVPLTLHEVLLFREEAHAVADDAECYAPDAPAPRFAGRAPDDYLLCFKHDRLSRIQASVRLADPGASGEFAAGCAGWLRHAAPGSEAQSERACEGREGGIRFSARLEEESILSMTLDNVSEP